MLTKTGPDPISKCHNAGRCERCVAPLLRAKYRTLLSQNKLSQNKLSPNKKPWPVLFSALIWLLAACDNGGGARNATTRASAERLPSGESVLPLKGIDAQLTMAPADFYQLFKNLEAAGIQAHLASIDAQPALLLVEVDLELFEPVLVGTDGGRRPGVSAGEAIATFDLDLVVGSSFVSELHSLTPVGLLQIEGTTISELQSHGYTRVLGVRADGLGVVASRE